MRSSMAEPVLSRRALSFRLLRLGDHPRRVLVEQQPRGDQPLDRARHRGDVVAWPWIALLQRQAAVMCGEPRLARPGEGQRRADIVAELALREAGPPVV